VSVTFATRLIRTWIYQVRFVVHDTNSPKTATVTQSITQEVTRDCSRPCGAPLIARR